MQQSHFSRKCRHLKSLADRFQTESRNGEYINSPHVLSLIKKIKILWAELRKVFSTLYLRRLLGSAGAFAGIVFGNAASAQSFAVPVINPFNMEITEGMELQPAFADFDGDGDLDVIWGGLYGNFNYFENIGTADTPEFAEGVPNPFGLSALDDYALPVAVDLDNDGDYDLLVTSYYADFYYYENIGTATNPIFAAPVLNPFGLEILNDLGALLCIGDMDGDGDYDILSSGYYSPLQYFENTGIPEAPVFANPVFIPFGLDQVEPFIFLMLGDLDLDGDLDILTRNYYGNFVYYENLGTPETANFAAPVSNPFGLSLVDMDLFGPPVLVDMDGDGDLDILQNDYYGNIIYIENTTIVVSQYNVEVLDLNIYPNPTTDILNISTEAVLRNIEILDLNGRVVAAFGNERALSLKTFENGTYLVRLVTGEGIVVRKIQVVK